MSGYFMSIQTPTQTASIASPSSTIELSDRPTVLIVDDDPNLRMLLSYALEQEGYHTIEAQDGMTAIQVVEQHRPTIILMDAVMPQLDGIGCCMKLQESFQAQCPPIIFITALADVKSIDRAFEAGARDFVTKPIHWPILRERLKRMLEFINLQRDVRQAKAEIQQLRERLPSERSAEVCFNQSGG
jgi:PleD family two-component response regulator